MEVGFLQLDLQPKEFVEAGDVGYIISGIKAAKEVKVGDTITSSENPSKEAVQGFKK